MKCFSKIRKERETPAGPAGRSDSRIPSHCDLAKPGRRREARRLFTDVPRCLACVGVGNQSLAFVGSYRNEARLRGWKRPGLPLLTGRACLASWLWLRLRTHISSPSPPPSKVADDFASAGNDHPAFRVSREFVLLTIGESFGDLRIASESLGEFRTLTESYGSFPTSTPSASASFLRVDGYG